MEPEESNVALSNAVWVDLIEPEEDERDLVQQTLGQGLATRPELEDIEASARFSKTKTGYISTHSSFMKMLTITRGMRQSRLLSVMDVFSPYVNVSFPLFAYTGCVPAAKP